MDLPNRHNDELISTREALRIHKKWNESDLVRNELDSRAAFIFDTPEGPEVYYELKGTTRTQLMEKQTKDRQASTRFDAWLFSMK